MEDYLWIPREIKVGLKVELLNTFSNGPEKEMNNEMTVFAKINAEVIKWLAGIIS